MVSSRTTLEICAGSYDSALAAAEGGAHRIELCCALNEGGLTPSLALIRRVVALDGPDVFVLIRPRGGDFLYSPEECEIIEQDIRIAVAAGVKGVVVGALTPQGDINAEALRRWIVAAEGRSVTFHRAFDLCRNPFVALETIIELGCTRLLTSGQAVTAEAGIALIRELHLAASGRISVMPGSGISAQNVSRILRETGVNEVHASARRTRSSLMAYRRDGVGMGKKDADEYMRLETSSDAVRGILRMMEGIRHLERE